MAHVSRTKQLAILESCERRCWYCGTRLSLETLHVDHKTPRSQGGTNGMDNLVPACGECNMVKGPMNVEEFREKIAGVPENISTRTRVFFRITGFQFPKPEGILFYGERT